MTITLALLTIATSRSTGV